MFSYCQVRGVFHLKCFLGEFRVNFAGSGATETRKQSRIPEWHNKIRFVRHLHFFKQRKCTYLANTVQFCADYMVVLN